MAVDQVTPGLDEVLDGMGRAGRAMAAISAVEAAAGNISVCLRGALQGQVDRLFPMAEPCTLPDPVPSLAGHTLIVTGSGRRLREVADQPLANLGAVVIDDTGTSATLCTSRQRRFVRLTSELNSHLAVHADQVERTGAAVHSLIHAQPPRITLLSQIAEYRTGDTMTRRLLRWEPETIVNLPEGLCVLPYLLPGSAQLMAATVDGLRGHRVVVWSKHGVMARSEISVTRAADLIEYAETAALYEYLDLAAGGRGEGLTDDELREIVAAFDVPTTLF